MIRIIVRVDDATMAANVGGSVHQTVKTFDVSIPDLEELLRKIDRTAYSHANVIGVELLESAQ